MANLRGTSLLEHGPDVEGGVRGPQHSYAFRMSGAGSDRDEKLGSEMRTYCRHHDLRRKLRSKQGPTVRSAYEHAEWHYPAALIYRRRNDCVRRCSAQ